MMMPSPHFIKSVSANVAYWSERTRRLDSDGIRAVDTERQNLYRAADFGLGLEETWRETTDLVLQSYPLIDERDYSRDWITLLEAIIIKCPRDDLTLTGRVLGQLGTLYRRRRHLDKALAIHLEEEQLGVKSGNKERIAFAHMHLANVHYRLRQYDQAGKQAQDALATFRIIAPRSEMVAASLSAAGLIATNSGDLDSAERWLLEAVEHYRSLDLAVQTGRALMNLGNILEKAERYDEAIERYHEARAQFITSGNKIGEMQLNMSLGTLLYHRGKIKEAEEVFRRADSQYLRQWGTSYQIAQIKMNLANVLLAQEKLDESEAYWRECIPEWRQADARLMLANSLGGLAETLVGKGDIDQAIDHFDEALEIIAEYPTDTWARKLDGMFSQERAEALEIRDSGGHPHAAG
jgi:tetratricopeptide (TPR) repeat protein